MANITGHWWLILAILVVVLIIWGPGKLPDVGAGMGRAIREFRKASSETRETIVNATAAPASTSSAPNGSAASDMPPTTSDTPAASTTPEASATPAGSGQREEHKS